MKLGANEPKKVAVLAVLVVTAGYLVYTNLLSGPPALKPAALAVSRAAPEEQPAPAAAAGAESSRAAAPRAIAGRGRTDEFHPVLHSKRPEDRIDPDLVDPTLRLDLLAKLQQVELSASGRNLFQTGPPPVKADPLKGPEPKITLNAPAADGKSGPSAPPGPPPPAPITLKYYGYSSASANSPKTAFFLDGDDILIAKEGETLKRRYRVVRIGVNSVVMEDTESKRQQTLPLAEEAG